MIRNLMKYLGNVNALVMLREELETASKIAEAENQLATVTSGGFVRAISPVLKELCYMSPEPGTEVYIRHLKCATELILEGNEQAEVIAYYDNKLDVKKQIAKKVNLYICNDAVCPSCNKRLRGYEGMKIAYCKFCGQLIKGEGVIDDSH